MNIILKILICVGVAILQLTLMPIFNIWGVIPNLVLIGAVALVLMELTEYAFLLAGVAGLVLDFGSSLHFGLNTLILVGLVFSLQYLVVKFLPEINLFIFIIIIFIYSLVFALIMNLFLSRFSSFLILIDGAYSMALSLIFFYLLQWFQRQSQVIKLEKN